MNIFIYSDLFKSFFFFLIIMGLTFSKEKALGLGLALGINYFNLWSWLMLVGYVQDMSE